MRLTRVVAGVVLTSCLLFAGRSAEAAERRLLPSENDRAVRTIAPPRFDRPLVIERLNQRVVLRPLDALPAAAETRHGHTAYARAFPGVDVSRSTSGAERLLVADRAALDRIVYSVADMSELNAVVSQGQGVRFLSRNGAASDVELGLGRPEVVDASGRHSAVGRWIVQNGATQAASLRIAVDDPFLRFPITVSWAAVPATRLRVQPRAASHARTPVSNAVGSFSGTVTQVPGGAPLAGVSVDVYTDAGEYVTSAVTDGGGSYSVAGVEAGSYRAVVMAFGFTPALYNNIPCNGCDVTTGTPIAVAAGSNTSGINFTLSSNISRITGTVRNAALTPLANVTVGVYSSTGVIVAAGESDDSGAYEITLDAGGTYYARTINNVYPGVVDQLYAGIDCSGCNVVTGAPITVALGGVAGGVDFALKTNGGRISGTITEAASGTALTRAQILVFNSAGRLVTFAYSDDAGAYLTYHGLATGTYFVKASSFGHGAELYDNIDCALSCTPTAGTPVAVALGSTTAGIDLALGNTIPRVSGRVSDALTNDPLGGVYVYFFDASGNPVRAAVSSYDDGTYVLQLKEPGTYFARTFNYVHEGYRDELYSNQYCTLCDVTTGTPITVDVDATTEDIDFSLDQTGGWISGRVLDSGGAAIAGAYVIVYAADGSLVTYGLADSNGDYTIFSRIDTGNYYAVASAEGHDSILYDAITCATGCDPVTGSAISVTAGATTTGIDFFLPAAGCPVAEMSPETLPGGSLDDSYSQTITVTGLTAPVSFSILSGALPTGLTLSSGGVIAGTLDAAGEFSFVVGAEGSDGCSAARGYTIAVAGQPTTTTLTASPQPGEYGEPITLTATVSPSAATGDVDFLVDGLHVATSTVSGGVATASTQMLAGVREVVASYRGGGVYAPSSSDVLLVTVDKGTPDLIWADPAPIVYGTALSGVQLNAEAPVHGGEDAAPIPGTFVYTPPAGTILSAGTHTLSVTFTADDTANYNPSTATVTLVVEKAEQTLTWATPADIVYGTLLDSTQLNATVSVVGPSPAGALTYAPPAGTLLGAGTHTLTVNAAATGDYNAASASVQLVVLKATPLFSDLSAPVITIGTATVSLGGKIAAGSLIPTGSVQITLGATTTAAVIAGDGTFSATFNTAALAAGSHSIGFAYAGDANFNAASGTSTLTVTYGVSGGPLQPSPAKAGSTIPMRVSLLNAAGVDISSASLALTVVGIRPIGGGAFTPVTDAFSFQAGAYRINLKTPASLASGTWELGFTVTGDPVIHTVTFVIK